MRFLIFSLVVLSCSTVCAQWGYVPIERSRSYQSVGRYVGPVYPGYGYYGYGRIEQPVTVYLRWDATDPMLLDRSYRYRGR